MASAGAATKKRVHSKDDGDVEITGSAKRPRVTACGRAIIQPREYRCEICMRSISASGNGGGMWLCSDYKYVGATYHMKCAHNVSRKFEKCPECKGANVECPICLAPILCGTGTVSIYAECCKQKFHKTCYINAVESQKDKLCPTCQTDTKPHRINLHMKTLTDQTHTINNAWVYDSIEELKYKVQDITGIPPDQQRLIHAGRQLDDGRTIQFYQMKNDSTIHVILRLSGS